MEAFVAVATAQGDDSPLSQPSSLDVSSAFSTSYRSALANKTTSSNNNASPPSSTPPTTTQNNNKVGGVGKGALTDPVSSAVSRANNNSTNFGHLVSSHLHPSVTTSGLNRREFLDNGHYWKYLVGDAGAAALAAAATINNCNLSSSNNNKMVPQEPAPTATGNECAVSKTPSPSGEQISDSTTKSRGCKLPEVVGGGDGFQVPNSRKSSSMTGGGAAPLSTGGSDVEHFDGRIVYNPDGSAYIIDDSELSEEDGSLDVPHLEGCIVDGRGVSLSQIPPIPPIASAFYVSRNPALYSALYGQAYSNLLNEKKIVPDIPIMHSYRVYTVRDNKSGDMDSSVGGGGGGDEEIEEDEESGDEESEGEDSSRPRPPKSRVKRNRPPGSGFGGSLSSSATSALECSSVPIKPILMCFICKLSFGYTKSFVGHAMGDHSLILTDQEKDILNQRNVSAIIQAVGKTKDPLISFLEPMGNSIGGGINFSSGRERETMTSATATSAATSSVPNPNIRGVISRLNELPHNYTGDENLVGNSLNSGAMNLSGVNRDSSPQHSLLFSPRGEQSGGSASEREPSASPMNKISVATNNLNLGVDLTRKSPNSGRSSLSPDESISPLPLSSTPLPGGLLGSSGTGNSPNGSQFTNTNNGPGAPPNFMTGTTIGVCPEHMNGRPSGVDCQKCELILNSSRMGALGSLHTRNSCKTLKCPKCNWHYKYQETLEIHMKEKHPDNETSCIYCIAGQPHPRLARGETYTCGYKPYRCEVCNYSTTTKGNLSIHMQSDKHLNNMQELQNGGVPPPESLHQTVQQSSGPHKGMSGMSPSAGGGHGGHTNSGGGNQGNNASSSGGAQANPKPKPTFRCDVCNYETNVARNLRIHMTSEKHTHNMMVLQQNVKHMQHLSALQAQAQAQSPFDPATAALLQFHPSLAGLAAGGGGGDKAPAHTEAALADMAYNQALLIQMMTGGQLPPHIPPELAPHMDLGLNPDTMEPPPEPPDPNPSHLFQCCVCTSFHTDSLESLSHHLTQDRTKLREQEILVLVAGNYMCKLCSYKTNLKANFQLHCKTDKHLQRLQHVNHIKEGGGRNEWKLKYLSMSNPIQVRCNACDYYTNSAHKLQLHAAHQRHEISVLIFRHIQAQENLVHEDARIFACALCGFTSRVKLQLLQHTRSLKHLQLEQLHSLQRRAEGKDGQPDLNQVFRVLEQPDSDSSPGQTPNHHQHHHPHHNNSSDISPNIYSNDQDGKDLKKEERRGSSVLKNALEKEGDDLSCPFCNFIAESESRLQSHLTTKHSGSDISLQAGPGRLRTASSSSPEQSSNKAEISGIFPPAGGMSMTCPLCQDPCHDRSSLENHVMQVHSVNAEGLQRLLLLVNQSHWLNTTGSGGNNTTGNTTTSSSRSAGNQSSSSADLKSDSNDEADKDKLSESEECGSDGEEFRCSTCAKCFRVLDELCAHQNELGHLEIKQTPGGPGYLCWKKGCNQYFPTAPSLQMHFREIHAARAGGKHSHQSMAVSEKHVYKYRCNQCSLAFKTMEKLQLHSQYHAIRDASKCCLCGRSFRSLIALQKHVETSHTELSEDEIQQFKHSIATNPLLLAGLTGQVLDPGMNELLKKESAREELQEQMMLEEEHSLAGENPDADGDGDGDSNDDSTGNSGSGKDQQQLFEDYLNTQAMAEDSYNDPNRKYKCHRCKVAFTRQSYLTSHNKTLLHRKGEKLSYPMEKYLDPNRPYKCEVCKESFTQKNILLVHYNSVSHLHKLKRAMQEQQHFLNQVGSNNNNANANAGLQSPLMSPVGSTGATSTVGTKVTATTPTNNNSSGSSEQLQLNRQSASSTSLASDDEDKKPFKCNICKVAYSQGSTLDIHMRSVLHQTRASKLQELAMTGQIDLSKPLIEQPEPQKLQDQHKKLMAEMLSPSNSKIGDSQPQYSSTPARGSSSSPLSQSQNSSPMLQSSISPAGGLLNSSSSPGSSGAYSCPRCGAISGSQEQLIQHQHLYCMFQNPMAMFPPLPSPNSTSTPNTSMIAAGDTAGVCSISPAESPTPAAVGSEEGYQRFMMPSRKSSQLYKHILESYGFEIVMQFNEYHQKRLRRSNEDDEESTIPSLDEQQILSEFPELARSTCPYCKKVFSSVWILKAHCEEIHKDIVSMEILENFAEDFKNAYALKLEVAGAASGTANEIEMDKDMAMELELRDGSKGSSGLEQTHLTLNNPTAPSTPTASSTPASSADSVTGGSNNNTSAGSSGGPAGGGGGGTNSQHSNIPMALAQHMTEVQNALMAASQLHQFNPMLNPMMMAAGLGMGLPFNMNALAAMNLQPPLVSMMMPPPFDHMNQGNSNTNSLFGGQQMDHNVLAKQQQQMLQQQQQQQQQHQAAAAAAAASAPNSANSQQKRARTRITDEQLKILRAHFDINNSPSEDQIQQMAGQSGLPPKVIKHWFRNTLFKERQRNKDSPYNFSNPPSTTLNLEEYEKTGETKVKALDPEEQKLYQIPSLNIPLKKEVGSKKLSQQQQQQQQQQQVMNMNMMSTHLSNAFHHMDPSNFHLLGFGDGSKSNQSNHDIDGQSHGDISETESKSEDERPRKRAPPSKGGGTNSKSHKAAAQRAAAAAAAAANLAMTVPDANSSSSPSSLTLSSLITSHMEGGQSQQPMLPPPLQQQQQEQQRSNFATPNSTTVPNSSLLSLASPVSLSSPAGSIGRPESSSMTTPPLSNCGSQSGMSSGKRANRTRFTDYQIKVLQEFFENNAYPKDDDLEYLSKLLGLSPRVIVVWFQNARQKARKVYENQPPVDTTQDESTGRFQRTPGLNYQCKKCLLVFQRYYELIRHQKTHCFKEEDAKRSAQAQAAAAQVAAAMSSEDSNSSNITDNSGLTSSCGPSPSAAVALGNSNNSNQSAASAAAHYNAEMKSQQQGSNSSADETFQCDKCNLMFSRFELWREHQLVHIMNPNLFPQFSQESPFGILQQHAHQQQQERQQQQQLQQVQIKVEQKDPCPLQQQQQQSHSAASSTAGDATAKRKWSADEYTDDDKDEQPRDKRLRTTILPEQLDYLYQKYQIESNPSRKMLETIAREVGLKKRVVQVWFQNTRARERKGQFRAHAQVINKRCPLCPALFKVKSALETHLAAKHADQYSKGEINIDALPDEEFDGASSPILGDNTKVPISFGNINTNTSSLGAPPDSASPSSNIMNPFLQSLSTHAELETSLKKLYEESLKRYAQEVQQQHHSIVGAQSATTRNHNGRPDAAQTPTDLRLVKTESENQLCFPGGGGTGPGEFPLDLSKPVDLTRALSARAAAMDDSMDTHDYLSDGDDFDASHDSNPNSPASSTASCTQRPTCGGASGNNNSSGGSSGGGGGKRFRTQMSSLQVKVMKNLFADYKTPTMAECEMLGREIGLAKRVIQVWFQNARAKEKKAKLALQKSVGVLGSAVPPDSVTPPEKLPEECRLCAFKYSHKYSVQDHIFTRKHIDTVKAFIESSGKLKTSGGNKGNKNINTQSEGQGSQSQVAQKPTSTAEQLQQQKLLQQLHLLQYATANSGSNNNSSNTMTAESTTAQTTSFTLPTDSSICKTTKTPNSEDQLSFLQLCGLTATPQQQQQQPFSRSLVNATSDQGIANTATKPSVSSNMMGGEVEKIKEERNSESFGVGTADLEVGRTSSPTAEIRSEMEYVVQKIAALARAASTDEEPTDSNANICFEESD